MIIMQGDAYYIPFLFFDDDETQITDDMVTEVEIQFGGLKKTMSSGEITYSDGEFLFPLTQAESSGMVGTVKVLAWLTFTNGDRIGASFGHVIVLGATS